MAGTTLAALVVATVCLKDCDNVANVQQTSLHPFNLGGVVYMTATETSLMWPLENRGSRDENDKREFVASLLLRHFVNDLVQGVALAPVDVNITRLPCGVRESYSDSLFTCGTCLESQYAPTFTPSLLPPSDARASVV